MPFVVFFPAGEDDPTERSTGGRVKEGENHLQIRKQKKEGWIRWSKAILQDYTSAIEIQKNYLRQQQFLFSGIALILLVISLFHIVNSMNHSILSRRREYGIIRAMGITDSGFYKMILQTGVLYGLLADLFIFLLYNLVLRRVMDYYMAHVLQLLHLTSAVPNMVLIGIMLLNIVIAAAAVLFPARKMIKTNIIKKPLPVIYKNFSEISEKSPCLL